MTPGAEAALSPAEPLRKARGSTEKTSAGRAWWRPRRSPAATLAARESVIEKSRDAYYLALRRTQATLRTDAPDWSPWLVYFPRALRQQKRRLQQKIERERVMTGDLPELSLQVLEIARDHGRVTVAGAAKATGASRNTIKDHLKALTRDGRLTRHGAGRGTWYAPA